MKLYFAYGANLNIESMRWRCPDAVPVEAMYLQDYRLAFSGVATIQPSPGEFVPGALWAITEKCEAALDIFEGYPTFYRKQTVTVDGMEIMFYVMNHDLPGEPSVNYLMTIAEGYQDWQLQLDDLWSAVRITQEESYDRMHRGNTPNTISTHRDVESMVYMESGNDLRWLRDDEYTHRDPAPF